MPRHIHLDRTAVWMIIATILFVYLATSGGLATMLAALGLMITSFWTGTSYLRWYAGWKAERGEKL
jgi:hypothetical protein